MRPGAPTLLALLVEECFVPRGGYDADEAHELIARGQARWRVQRDGNAIHIEGVEITERGRRVQHAIEETQG